MYKLKKGWFIVKALKGNREYSITEAEKTFYQKQGFDIIDDKGEVIEYGAGKTVSYEQYVAVVKELTELKEKVKGFNDTDISELKKEELIDLIMEFRG